jgi:hypothetical protein
MEEEESVRHLPLKEGSDWPTAESLHLFCGVTYENATVLKADNRWRNWISFGVGDHDWFAVDVHVRDR